MKHAIALILALTAAGAAHAHSCKDAEGRYWFQDEPCAPGMTEERFPAVPLSLITDTPPPLGSELPPELAHYRVNLGWAHVAPAWHHRRGHYRFAPAWSHRPHGVWRRLARP